MLRVWLHYSRCHAHARIMCFENRQRRHLRRWRAFVRAASMWRQARLHCRQTVLRCCFHRLRVHSHQARERRVLLRRRILHQWRVTTSRVMQQRMDLQHAGEQVLRMRRLHALHRWHAIHQQNVNLF